MGEERDDDDIHVADARSDGIRAVEERDTAQRAHGHGYSWTHEPLNIMIITNIGGTDKHDIAIATLELEILTNVLT